MIDVVGWYIAVTWMGVMRYTLESNYSRYENVILSPSLFEGKLSL